MFKKNKQELINKKIQKKNMAKLNAMQNSNGSSINYSNKVIGIDLGTTNSAVSVIEGGRPVIIINPDGNRTTPSVVSFKNNTYVVGEKAKRQALLNPNTITSIKRHMGEKDYVIHIGSHAYDPQQISAMILGYIKHFASSYMGQPINKAVITVPAYFDDAQRQATKDAGKIAGLDVKRIINEPTAAALAFGVDNNKKQKVLVYDLGGGTFDVSILQLGGGVFQVLSTNGNTHLGGDDFDKCIMDWIINNFKQQHNIDLSQDALALQRIKNISEQAKIKLSTNTETEISLPFITSSSNGPLHIHTILTRTKFNKLTAHLVQKTREPVMQALKDANITYNDIDTVILNGGSTYIPAVRQAVSKWMHKKPSNAINPDEAVAKGAAIQGGIITGEVRNMVLLDVTPLSLGIRTVGNIFSPLIHRNTTIPTEHTKTFTTAINNQPFVKVQILQGERPIASDNKLLGSFTLDNIPKEPAGVPQIAVTFSIDKNGIVNVRAQDRNTGKRQQITIKNANNLSKNAVNQMTRVAQANYKQDLSRKNANLRANQNIQTNVNNAGMENYVVPNNPNQQQQRVMGRPKMATHPIAQKMNSRINVNNQPHFQQPIPPNQRNAQQIQPNQYMQNNSNMINQSHPMNQNNAQIRRPQNLQRLNNAPLNPVQRGQQMRQRYMKRMQHKHFK